MKPILKSENKLTLPAKLAIFIVFLTLFGTVLLNSFLNKNEKVPELSYKKELSLPECLNAGGFYIDSVTVTLSTSNNNTIYYTLDGSEPTLYSNIYTHPIILINNTGLPNNLSNIPTSPRWLPPQGDLFNGTVLRAICVENNNKSKELIRTFFIYKNNDRHYKLPVISITVNSEDLFGYKNGIYVLGRNYEDKDLYLRKNIPLDVPWWEYPSNYLKRGSNSERKAHIEFYDQNGKLGFERDAAVRISGNATRGFAQKSLRVSFDDEIVEYQLFPNLNTSRFKCFLLRNSGNDWSKTMFRDALMQSVMINSNLDIQAYKPSIVFINGEYWGIHNIRERFDENYIANKYHADLDSISILELDGSLIYGKKNDTRDFKKLLSFIKNNDLSQTINYQYLKNEIDIENFMDYIIANVYFCNSDWPGNNVKFWKYRTISKVSDSLFAKDGRWRWTLNDMDWGFGYTGKNGVQLNLLEKAAKTGSLGVIFGKLLTNNSFAEQFLIRFNYHIKNTFNTQHLLSKIDEFQRTLAPEMSDHINRWRVIGSYDNWENNVENLRHFALMRPAIQTEQLNRFMESYIKN